MHLINPRYVSAFFAAPLRDWMALNLNNNLGLYVGSCWSLVFGVAIWKLWGWQNAFLFDRSSAKPTNLAALVLNTWRNYAMQFVLVCFSKSVCFTIRTKKMAKAAGGLA